MLLETTLIQRLGLFSLFGFLHLTLLLVLFLLLGLCALFGTFDLIRELA